MYPEKLFRIRFSSPLSSWRFVLLSANRDGWRSGSWWNLFPVHSRAPRNRQFFHFAAAIRGRGACDIRPTAFTSFQPCRLVLPARLSVILRTRLSAYSFTPFARPFLSSFSSPPHPLATARCFHPFRLPAFRFLSSTTARFFSIDITPSRLPIAGTKKFRATQQFVRFFYWLLSYFRHFKPLSYPLFLSRLLSELFLSFPSTCTILYTHLHAGGRRRTTGREDPVILLCERKGK